MTMTGDYWMLAGHDHGDIYRYALIPLAKLSGLVCVVMMPVAFILVRSVYRHLRKQRNERMASLGLCVGCGYSLKGNTSGVCPECGNEISPDVKQRCDIR